MYKRRKAYLKPLFAGDYVPTPINVFKADGAPLIQDTFIARRTGAMILSIYNRYCGFGGAPITIEYNKTFNIDEDDKLIIGNFVEKKESLNLGL